MADPVAGNLWAGTPDSLTGLDPKTTDPLLSTAAGVAVATSVNGTVFAVAPGQRRAWRRDWGPIDATGRPRGWTVDDARDNRSHRSRPGSPVEH